MSTTLTPNRPRPSSRRSRPRELPRLSIGSRRHRHWIWLAAGFPLAFAVPFLFADTLALNRDLYYGLYAAAVTAFVAGWAWHTGLTRRDLHRNWRWGLALGAAGAAATILIVLRTEDATDRPGGLEFVGALLWRGVVYGATDGILLSVFPILAVFAAFTDTQLRSRRRGKIMIGALALVASLGITAVYHLGYSDFRSDKLRKPIVGDVIWSAPTLVTLSPLGAPIAHIGLHIGAVVHSYDTDTFLPPHAATPTERVPAPAAHTLTPRRHVVVYFLRGEQLAPVARVVAGPNVARATVLALLRGPSAAERQTGLVTSVPAGTRLRSVAVERGTAAVDLTGRFAAGGGSLSMASRLAQVTYTLTQRPNVQRVVYLLDGRRITTLGGEGLIVDKPQTRAVYEQARPEALEAGLLGSVFVAQPAQGAAFTNPLTVKGSSTGPFTLTITDWDGRIVAEQTVANNTGTRQPFLRIVRADPGQYPRGAVIIRENNGRVIEIPIGAP